MGPVALEPSLPDQRLGVDGLEPDQLVEHIGALAEWGHGNANRVLDWQERERSLGPCLTAQTLNLATESDVEEPDSRRRLLGIF